MEEQASLSDPQKMFSYRKTELLSTHFSLLAAILIKRAFPLQVSGSNQE